MCCREMNQFGSNAHFKTYCLLLHSNLKKATAKLWDTVINRNEPSALNEQTETCASNFAVYLWK